MKDRVREAIFNLLGPAIRGKHAVDLFAGTGALGLEALSRGAARATLVEQHFPTARIIRQNATTLDVLDLCELVTADTFLWAQHQMDLESTACVFFSSPPYDFYVHRTDQMLQLIRRLLAAAPPESIVVVEADRRFDFRLLPDPHAWDVRPYLPAVVAIYRKANTPGPCAESSRPGSPPD